MAKTYPHLPPDRTPGPQTRSSRGQGRFGVLVCAAAGAFFVGCGVYLYTLRNSPQWEGKPVAAVEAFLAVCAALMFLLAWWVARRGRLRQAGHLSVDLDRRELRRGDPVTAALTIVDSAELSGELQIGLVCVERYDHEETTTTADGTSTQRVTAEAVVHEEWEPVDRAQARQNVILRVPSDGLCSYEGECLSYAWRVSVREVRSRRRDPRTDVPIWVTP